MGALGNYYMLSCAHNYALLKSKCKKVKVGTVIVKQDNTGLEFYYGANVVIPDGCDGVACNRVLPHDGLPHCVSTIHSEIDAIARAKTDLTGATAYVTRYPCENCARALVVAGITKVVYGRINVISEDVSQIFKDIEVIHVPSFNPPEGVR